METIVEVTGLQKSFGDIRAVQSLDFAVKRGQLFAFLGPNGAGKSTTIDMLCTLLQPDGGTAVVDGHALGKEDEKIRRSIGVVFQTSVLDPLLTVRENLMTRANFYGLNRHDLRFAADRAGRAADAVEFMDRPYGKLSGGQKRRADIARALVHTPRLLFLDEPTTGLDPKTKEGVWRTVTNLQKETGMTVFLTTHYMEEAAQADYITIVKQGQLAAAGTPYALQEQYSTHRLCMKAIDPAKLRETLLGKNLYCTEKGGLFILHLQNTLEALPVLTEVQPLLESFQVLYGTMEDVFLNLIGEENDNA